MFKGITWGQYGIFILLAVAGYYVYIGLRFWRAGIIPGAGRRKSRSKDVKKVLGRERVGKADAESAVASKSDQAEVFELADRVGEGNELFIAMQKAMKIVEEVVARGEDNKLDRENLLDHVREVLRGYRQLRGTEYAETINNYLVRVCASELSLRLSERDLAELWK